MANESVNERKYLNCVYMVLQKSGSGKLALKVIVFNEISILLYHLLSKSEETFGLL